MEIVKVNINELISPEYNPRQITDDEMEKLKNSINEFGYIAPIIVNKHNNHIVGGNQRYEALKQLGYTMIDVIYIDEPDINKEKALNIRLNNLSGEWDMTKLEKVIDELKMEKFDITLTGFEIDNVESFDDLEVDNIHFNETITSDLNTGLKPEINQSNADEPVTTHKEDEYAGGLTDDDVTVKIGDVYVLGNHRLMCGDSSDRQNIDILIDKDKIDLILTDPPYGINIVNTNGKNRGRQTGHNQGTVGVSAPVSFKGERESFDWNRGNPGVVQAKRYKPILNDDKPYDPTILLELNVDSIIWGANNFASKLPDSPKWLVWYKKPMDKSNNNNNFSDVELAWTNIKGKMCKMYSYLWSGLLREGNRKMELKERVHPTQKPVGLLINILNDYSDVNMNILDLYGGSGSTLIACEETNRNCYMMELDPYYCQVIINRWENYTGKTAMKIN